MKDLTIVASIDRDVTRGALEAARGVASWLEVRAEQAGEIDAARLRRHFGGKLLFTLRDRDESDRRRRGRLIEAASRFDLVDLQLQDLVPRVLEAIAPERRVLSTTRLDGAESLLATPAA